MNEIEVETRFEIVTCTDWKDIIDDNEFDVVKKFLDSETSFIKDQLTQTAILYNEFLLFCNNNNYMIDIKQINFSKLVKQSSPRYDSIRKSDGMYWVNLQLKSSTLFT